MKLANSAKYLLVCDCLTSPARRPVKSRKVFLTEHHLSSPWTVSPLQETHRKDMVLINGTSVSNQSILAIIATHRQSNPCETPDYRQLVLQAEVPHPSDLLLDHIRPCSPHSSSSSLGTVGTILPSGCHVVEEDRLRMRRSEPA
jgi:hypothetical protein